MKKSACFILGFLLFWSCNKPMEELFPENKAQRTIPVYVTKLGWHTAIVIERVHLEDYLPTHPRMPHSNYLMIGWGDGKYYPHPDPGTGLLLRAALWPTESVLHVVGIDIPVENYFSSSRIVRIMIHQEGADKLAEFIASYFEVDELGIPVFAAEGLYRNSAFFEAKSAYFFPRTSNRWVAQALRRTGYPITPFYALTADNVMKQASEYGEVIR